eukprot:9501200-Pyramimonas_sp.AAC.1
MAALSGKKAQLDVKETEFKIAVMKYIIDIMRPAAARVEGHRKHHEALKEQYRMKVKQYKKINEELDDLQYQIDRAHEALVVAIQDRDGEEEEAEGEMEDEHEQDLDDEVMQVEPRLGRPRQNPQRRTFPAGGMPPSSSAYGPEVAETPHKDGHVDQIQQLMQMVAQQTVENGKLQAQLRDTQAESQAAKAFYEQQAVYQ